MACAKFDLKKTAKFVFIYLLKLQKLLNEKVEVNLLMFS